jgi:hypothetical protein
MKRSCSVQKVPFYLILFSLFTLLPLTPPSLNATVHTDFVSSSSGSDLPSKDHTKRKKDYHSTKHKEIVQWIDLKGGQYVLGMGEDKTTKKLVPFAIFDKTFARPAYIAYWRSLLLTTVGINDLNLGKLAKLYHHYTEKKKENLTTAYIYDLMFDKNSSSIFENTWWKNPYIKWKDGKKPDSNGPSPVRISLSDLEWDLTSKGSQYQKNKQTLKFKELYVKYNGLREGESQSSRNTKETELSDDEVKELVSYGDFILQDDDTYKLVVDRSDEALQPTKVIDLQGRFSSYNRSLTWASSTMLAKQLTRVIPVPILNGVIYAGFERFFNLLEVLYLDRHAMALTLVLEALDGNESSPFYEVLTEAQLHDAVIYLRRSSTMLSDLIYQGFSNKWKVADKYIKYVQKTREESLAYLLKDGYKVYPFESSYYALGLKRNEKGDLTKFKIFSLIKKKYFGKRPHEVVNYLNPNKERRKRNIFEAILVGTAFVPGVTVFYKELFIREIHRRDMAEAGFRTHMNHSREELLHIFETEGFSSKEAKSLVTMAYDMIYDREMNPVDIEYKEELLYVNKVNNWIRERDQTYTPVPLLYR